MNRMKTLVTGQRLVDEGKRMQRPSMDPTFTYEKKSSTKTAAKAFNSKWQRLMWVKKAMWWAGRALFAPSFGKRPVFRNEEGTRFSRFMRALTYRLAFAPLLLVLFLIAIVMAATHPRRTEISAD